jgi:hypothetical protein
MSNDAELKQLKDSLLALGPLLPGTIRKVFLRCGKKNCHCQSTDKRHWHGPYYFWDRKEGKKLTSRSIPSDQVQLFQSYINNRREFERITRQMQKYGVAMAEGLRSQKKADKQKPSTKE